jgi:hypothetical protein
MQGGKVMIGKSDLQLEYIQLNHHTTYTVQVRRRGARGTRRTLGRFRNWDAAWEAAEPGEYVFSEETQTARRKEVA